MCALASDLMYFWEGDERRIIWITIRPLIFISFTAWALRAVLNFCHVLFFLLLLSIPFHAPICVVLSIRFCLLSSNKFYAHCAMYICLMDFGPALCDCTRNGGTLCLYMRFTDTRTIWSVEQWADNDRRAMLMTTMTTKRNWNRRRRRKKRGICTTNETQQRKCEKVIYHSAKAKSVMPES